MPIRTSFSMTVKIGDHYIKTEVELSEIPLPTDIKESQTIAEVDYEAIEKETEKAVETASKVVLRKVQAMYTVLKGGK